MENHLPTNEREPYDHLTKFGWMLFSRLGIERVKNKIDTWWISGEIGENVVNGRDW